MNASNFKSTAFCLPVIGNALTLANPECKQWQTSNDTQVRYFDQYGKSATDIDRLTPYLKGKVTSSTAELNAWFAENGWNMNIDIPPTGLGVGSIFDLLVNWLVPGISKEISLNQDNILVRYMGVEMTRSAALQAHKLEGYEYPMFELDTVEGWKVFIVEADASCEPFELPAVSKKILGKNRTPFDFEKLKFPFVEFEADVDISWMAGLAVKDGFHIATAKKKVKLRIDDKGARAKSVIYFATRGVSLGVYKVDKPFFVIFWRDGLEFPAFTALAGLDSWVKSR